MKTIALCGALIIGAAGAESAAAIDLETEAELVQITTPVTIPAGSGAATLTAFTVPSSKRLVIQSVSFYKYGGPVVAATAQISICTTFSGQQSFWTSAGVPDNGLPYPGASVSTTLYASPDSPVVINSYRAGDTSNPELAEVTITGYYIPKR